MITREALMGDWLAQLEESAAGRVRIKSEAELQDCRRSALNGHDPSEDLWVFAYGSLIWNPAFHFAERQKATIHGYHRCYCLWTKLGRGSEEVPGLMLGLDRGGSCAGVAYRIKASEIEQELPLIWRREMVTGSYRPTWLATRIEGKPLRTLGFVINHQHERYASEMTEQQLIQTLSTATGPLGSCAEYLFNTTEHLIELGIRDRRLEKLCRQVRERLDTPC